MYDALNSYLDTTQKFSTIGLWFKQQPHTIMIKKHKRIIVLLIASLVLSMFTSSCGTVSGVGQDISRAGRGLQKAAS
jgi:predicted small secreted protein